MITIACVLRSGGKVGYDSTWVDKLHNMIRRNTTRPFRFVCLSDTPVNCERIELSTTAPGYWAKLQLFEQGLFAGPTLYFDLDTVICNNIDLLIDRLLDQTQLVMWKDPDYKISSSAIMYWNGDYSNIYNLYNSNREYYEDRYSPANQGPERQIGDQAVISNTVNHIFVNDLVPASWIHVVSKDDTRYDLSDCRILIFRKANNKPSNQQNHLLVQQHWK